MTTTTHDHAGQQSDHPLVALKASDVMTSDVATVVTTTTVGEAMTLMRTLGVRHLPVLGDGRFAGIVDDRLVAFALLSADGFGDALDQPVTSAMTHYVPQVGPAESLQRAAHLLRSSRCDAIVVVDPQEHLLGIITMVDVVSAVAFGDALHGLVPDEPGPSSFAATNPSRAAAPGARS